MKKIFFACFFTVTMLSVFSQKDDNNDKVFTVVQVPAEFKGGLKGWSEYLQSNLDVNIAVKNGAPKGKYTVYLTFIVKENGVISDVKVENDPGYGTAKEAIRVIKKGPNWKPAEQNGKKVIYRHKQGITFVVS